jgi:hypothetical protein
MDVFPLSRWGRILRLHESNHTDTMPIIRLLSGKIFSEIKGTELGTVFLNSVVALLCLMKSLIFVIRH